jgi:hypothetical protein
MSGWEDFGVWEQRAGRHLSGSGGEDIEVRWGLPEDEVRIVELLELNGMPRWVGFEEQFIVAEKKGEVLAILRYQTASKWLLLGLLVTDPWAEERSLAAALYTGAAELAREMGVAKVVAWPVPYADYPYAAGYRRWARGWWMDAISPTESRGELPESGWRRMVALLSVVAVPFHRGFRHE